MADPLPPEAVTRLVAIEDWRARGLALSALLAEHDDGRRGLRSAALHQVARAGGHHMSGAHNLVSITRWLESTFPSGLDVESPRYALRSAIALRALWRRDPTSAERIADLVFAGRLGPAGIRDAMGLAAAAKRMQDAEAVAQGLSAHERLATRARRQALRAAVAEKLASEGTEVVDGRDAEGMPVGLCDLMIRRPDGAPILVHLALLPAPTSPQAHIDIASRVSLMERFGDAAVVLGRSRDDLVRRTIDTMAVSGLNEATILIAELGEGNEISLKEPPPSS